LLGINKAIAAAELGLRTDAISRAVCRQEKSQKDCEHPYLAGHITGAQNN
jgi:hypothetical protein